MLLGVDVVLGDKVMRGTVVARADGERAYEDALEDGHAAVLVERAGDGMYTVNVGNLLPGEQVLVRFRYAQLLSFAQGRIRLVVPTVIAPRYGDPRDGGLQPHQAPVTDLRTEHPFALAITLHGTVADAALSSPSHDVTLRSAAGSVVVALRDGARLDRDFVLLAEGLAGRSVTTLGRDGDGYVALASFCPAAEALPAAAPLNLKILVDCSGSMNGERIDAARRAVHDVLGRLEPADRFSYSCFGSDVRHFSASLRMATPRALRRAGAWIAATRADMGGTELRAAIASTLALAQPQAADLLLITDGDVWDADPLIASAERAGQRIFAAGIGSAPASSLLHALAARTGGACEFVAAHTDIQPAVAGMVRRMRQAPARDVAVTWDGPAAWQTGPGRTVFAGDTAHHFAGFAQRPPAGAVLAWRAHAGAAAHRLDVTIDATVTAGDTLARVAAAARLDDAAPSARHALALEYGLVGATTNLVLVHERAGAVGPAAAPVLHTVAQGLPAGWGGIGNAHGGAGLRAPAVWRREQASTAIQCAQRTGMELYDIPAFLRKQPGDANPYPYRDSLRRLVDTDGPFTLAMLAAVLPAPIVDALRPLVEDGLGEEDIVRAFLAAVAAQCRGAGTARRTSALSRWFGGVRLSAGRDPARRAAAIASWAFNARTEGAPAHEAPAWLRRAAD